METENSNKNKSEFLIQDKKNKTLFSSIVEIIIFILIALAIVIPFRKFIAEPFIVSGASMDPTFETGHYLIVDKLSYRFNDPKRGDVIVFKHPVYNQEKYLIKRVIALPNETISIKNGVISIHNKENPADFTIPDSHVIEKNMKDESITRTLEKNEYFVMGDNRANSSDSREWGPLDEDSIVGRPIIRLFPFSQIKILPGI